jgi:hypothetical protein
MLRDGASQARATWRRPSVGRQERAGCARPWSSREAHPANPALPSRPPPPTGLASAMACSPSIKLASSHACSSSVESTSHSDTDTLALQASVGRDGSLQTAVRAFAGNTSNALSANHLLGMTTRHLRCGGIVFRLTKSSRMIIASGTRLEGTSMVCVTRYSGMAAANGSSFAAAAAAAAVTELGGVRWAAGSGALCRGMGS